MQRLIVSGCRWAVPSDSDPGTGRLTDEAGDQYALRIRNACLTAAAVTDAGITAIVTDTIIGEGFQALIKVLGRRPVNFVVLRPPVALLRQRGIDRLPEERISGGPLQRLRSPRGRGVRRAGPSRSRRPTGQRICGVNGEDHRHHCCGEVPLSLVDVIQRSRQGGAEHGRGQDERQQPECDRAGGGRPSAPRRQ
jgi:hypothetical protein